MLTHPAQLSLLDPMLLHKHKQSSARLISQRKFMRAASALHLVCAGVACFQTSI